MKKTKIVFLIIIIILVAISFIIFSSLMKRNNLDLNGFWKISSSKNIYKITQTGNNIVFSWDKVDPNYPWQGVPGDIIFEGVLVGNKITGKVTLYPQKGHCIGHTWSNTFEATVSGDGKTINETYKYSRYNIATCQEIPNSTGERSATDTRI